MTLDQAQQKIQQWMHHHGAGVKLNCNPRLGKEERLAEEEKLGIVLIPAGGTEISHGIFKDIFRSSKTVPGEESGHDAIFGCSAGV